MALIKDKLFIELMHCVKSVRFRRYSGAHFPAFRLNTERYSISLRIQSTCGKMRTRITPNTDTFYAVMSKTTTFAETEITTLKT